MAGVTTTSSPDEVDKADGQSNGAVFAHQELVVETHKAIQFAQFTAHTVNRCTKVRINPGGDGGKSSKIRTRSDHLVEAIKEFPHLIRHNVERKASKETSKFTRRNVDVDRMIAVLDEVIRAALPFQKIGCEQGSCRFFHISLSLSLSLSLPLSFSP